MAGFGGGGSWDHNDLLVGYIKICNFMSDHFFFNSGTVRSVLLTEFTAAATCCHPLCQSQSVFIVACTKLLQHSKILTTWQASFIYAVDVIHITKNNIKLYNTMTIDHIKCNINIQQFKKQHISL